MSDINKHRITKQALAAFAIGVTLSAWINSQWGGMEDAYITYHYASRIAAGQGFTFSPGAPPTYGATSPLWTLTLAALAAVALPPHLAGPTLESLFHGLTAALVTAVGAQLLGPAVGLLAGILCATSLSVFFLTGGMETPLFTALAALTAWAGIQAKRSHRWRRTEALLPGLLLLTRPEALLLVVPIILFRCRESFRRATKLAAATALIYLPWALYAFMTFHDIVPFSLRAKHAVAAASGRMGIAAFLREYLALGHWSVAALYISLALAALGALALWPRESRFRAFILWLPLHYLILVKVGHAPDFSWYYAPPLWVAYLLIASALHTLTRFAHRPRLRSLAFAIPAALVLLALAWSGWNATAPLRAHNPYLHFHRMLADRVAVLSKPDDIVATEEIGNIAYWTGRPILDMRALTTPEALPHAKARDIGPMIRRWKPDLVVVLDWEDQPDLKSGYHIQERYLYWNGIYYNIYLKN